VTLISDRFSLNGCRYYT